MKIGAHVSTAGGVSKAVPGFEGKGPDRRNVDLLSVDLLKEIRRRVDVAP